MRPLLSARVVLLVVGIALVAVMFWARANPPGQDDPLKQAVRGISRALGLEVDPLPSAGPVGGLTVRSVRRGGPGERLGLAVGDRIVALGDRSVWHAITLAEGIDEVASRGLPVPIMVASGNKYRSVIIGQGYGRSRRAPAGRASP